MGESLDGFPHDSRRFVYLRRGRGASNRKTYRPHRVVQRYPHGLENCGDVDLSGMTGCPGRCGHTIADLVKQRIGLDTPEADAQCVGERLIDIAVPAQAVDPDWTGLR